MTTAKLCCPQCGQFESRVINVRPNKSAEYVYRRRQCLHCGYRFPTQERIVPCAGKSAPIAHAYKI